MNNTSNVQVIEASVNDHSDTPRFSAQHGSFTGQLTTDGEFEVRTVCLDDMWTRDELPASQVVKIDVERAELGVLSGARQLFSTIRPIIFLATHRPEDHRQCWDWLQATGYELSQLACPDEILALPRNQEQESI
jgi:hypothetical protein